MLGKMIRQFLNKVKQNYSVTQQFIPDIHKRNRYLQANSTAALLTIAKRQKQPNEEKQQTNEQNTVQTPGNINTVTQETKAQILWHSVDGP